MFGKKILESVEAQQAIQKTPFLQTDIYGKTAQSI